MNNPMKSVIRMVRSAKYVQEIAPFVVMMKQIEHKLALNAFMVSLINIIIH